MELDVSAEFGKLIAAARALSDDAGNIVQEILTVGTKQPLPREEVAALLTRVIDVMREQAGKRGDTSAVATLPSDVNAFVERVLAKRDEIAAVHLAAQGRKLLDLQAYN